MTERSSEHEAEIDRVVAFLRAGKEAQVGGGRSFSTYLVRESQPFLVNSCDGEVEELAIDDASLRERIAEHRSLFLDYLLAWSRPVDRPFGKDEVFLCSMVEAFRDAINSRSAAALGMLFRDDAEFVTVAAMRFVGRDAIVEGHRKLFEGPLRITLFLKRIDVRLLRPDVAFVSASWFREVASDASGNNMPPGAGELSFVATSNGETWSFASGQNTQKMTLPGPSANP